MPGYKTHITASSICGAALGGFSLLIGHIDPVTSVYGGALCAIGGIIPDIDSENSLSFKKCLAIVAGFSSLLLVSRLRDYLLDPQAVAIIGGGNFIFAWFFLGRIIQKATVHRGMCHSIPMAVLSGEIIFLLSSGGINERLYCGFAMAIGVLLHLILDEFYSVRLKKRSVKIKKSLGSALKIFNFDDKPASFMMFAILGFFTFLCVHEPVWSEKLPDKGTPEYVAQHGKEELRLIQNQNPDLYDLSVVQWAVENDLQIRPRDRNNKKWREIQNALSEPASGFSKAAAESSGQNNRWAASVLSALTSDESVGAQQEVSPPSGGYVPEDY